MGAEGEIEVFLCGDVMTGRGVDQVLPHPSGPALHEPGVSDALDYVRLAERANGEIRRPVGFEWIWGEALPLIRRADLRIVNLETSVTVSGDWEPKGINYRMHPRNVPCLSAAGIDCCALANNHVLDWGPAGLRETLDSLHRAGIRTAGAGLGAREAAAPAVLGAKGGTRLLVFAFAGACSGVPAAWAASRGRPGVNFLPEISERASSRALSVIARAGRCPGDRVLVSIHWGPNWGYEIADGQRAFARRLIDEGGVDVVHGHSSHHVKPFEIYRGRLILYGCGDLISDYEGIAGREEFRDYLSLAYFARLSADGALAALEMAPMRLKNFRLQRASAEEARFLEGIVRREPAPGLRLDADGLLRWRRGWNAAG